MPIKTVVPVEKAATRARRTRVVEPRSVSVKGVTAADPERISAADAEDVAGSARFPHAPREAARTAAGSARAACDRRDIRAGGQVGLVCEIQMYPLTAMEQFVAFASPCPSAINGVEHTYKSGQGHG